jgi:hypothetical protein
VNKDQEKVWRRLVGSIVYAMEDGKLSQQMCSEAVLEAEEIVKENAGRML